MVAVIDRHKRQTLQIIRETLADVSALPLEKAVRELIAAAIEAHRLDPKLHRVLAEQIPRIGRREKVEAFSRETFDLFKSYLETHRDELRITDIGLATFVCVTSIEALTHTAVLREPEGFSDIAMQELIGEASRLVVRYLQ